MLYRRIGQASSTSSSRSNCAECGGSYRSLLRQAFYLRALKSLGAAHAVAQCCRWKTGIVGSVMMLPAERERHVSGVHSSTQSSFGPL